MTAGCINYIDYLERDFMPALCRLHKFIIADGFLYIRESAKAHSLLFIVERKSEGIMTTKNKYNISSEFIGFIFCFILLFMGMSISVSAQDVTDHTVRVGAFEETYNMVNEKGERSGYGYEFLQNIAGYAGWTYEYETSSWSDCFTQLENDEVDILCGISYTEERAKDMLFSDMPMGEEKYYIYTDASNMNLTAANLKSFDGKNIGVLKDHIPENVLNEWETRYGLHTQHINISSAEETMEKLTNHEIDCFVSVEESRWKEYNISPITNIGESDIYFAINKNRADIKENLDSAMRRIKDDNPFYIDDLYKRYFSTQSSGFLSKDEKEWISEHGAIRIGYLNDDIGVSVQDPETGKLTGIIKDYVELAQNCLQGQKLEFELKDYDTRNEQLTALHDGEIDLIFHVSQNPYSAETNGFVLSDTVWTFNMAATTARKSFDENAENTVAVAKDNFALKAYISYNYPHWTIKEYETKEAAFKAMEEKKTDCFLSNSGTVSDYLRNQNIHSIFLTKAANASFAIRQGEPLLLSILNKTLMSIPSDKFSGAVVSYSNAMRKVTATDFIKDNFLKVSILVGITFSLVLIVVLGFLRKSMKAKAKSKQSASQTLKLNRQLEEKQKELQTALVEAQSANKAKTTFLNNMSHDIRTPINGIMGMLTMIERSGENQQQIKECLNKIKKSSQLLLSLVNDVLDMAKLESGTVILNNESVNLNQLCEEIMSTLSFQAEAAGIEVKVEHDDYCNIDVLCSSLHLKKILMNLFTNSVKYNKPNGSIYMSMRTIEQTVDQLTCEFKIEDTGIGMSDDFVKNKLFVPFVQADNSSRSSYIGTGLGMPIVKAIVEKMGGTINVESKLGEGSQFTVVLPFKIVHEEEKVKMTINPEINPVTDISGLHLLLVEDNELNAEIAQFILDDSGAKVEKAKNGLEALQKFEEAEPGTYDAILMDVMMPVMDGLTATRKIRALERSDAKTIPIIAMTANAFAEDVQKCLEAGMTAYLAKPLEMEKVIATIEQCCTDKEK